jgi:hypothetical protein
MASRNNRSGGSEPTWCRVLFYVRRLVLVYQPSRVQSTAQQWITAFAVMAVWPSLVLVPMAMGIAVAYFWRSLSFGLWEYFLCGLLPH